MDQNMIQVKAQDSGHDSKFKIARTRFRSRFTIQDTIQNWSDYDSGHVSRFRVRFNIGNSAHESGYNLKLARSRFRSRFTSQNTI